jgi:multidrug efflux pump subunit AcrA (membrane-fusion protein)
MASSARRGLELLLGPKHTWMKVWALLLFLMVVFLTFAKGDYRIEAPFIFEAPVQQAVVAPFDTYIKSISVEPGDVVEAGKTILGVLETSELRLKLAALKAEQLGHQKQMAASMRDRNTAEAQIAQAQSDKLAAEIRLLEQHIGQATLIAPITGRVVSEDLRRQIGAPVETGKIVFEIALIESLRAELYVPEELIASVTEGQTGELASVGHPDQRIRFVVERINPVADVVNDQNIFKVRAPLLEQPEWMRPGMEGIAKIFVGKKRYIWIGTHRLADWLRMKLWI